MGTVASKMAGASTTAHSLPEGSFPSESDHDQDSQDQREDMDKSVENAGFFNATGVSYSKDKEVAEWLRKLDLECYVEAFNKEHIDLQSIADLEDENFKELGVSVGHRIKIRKAIAELRLPRHETKIEYVCKVIVVGDTGTGKTSLIQRYTRGSFDRGYKATIGVDFCLKEIKWNKNTTVNVQMWDIAGQERFANLTRMYYKEAKGAFVVFDITRDRTFDAVLKWKADIDAKVTLPGGEVIPVILLANKCDLASTEYIINLDQFCEDHGFQGWFLTSAKENIGISEASAKLVQKMLANDHIRRIPTEREDVLSLGAPNPTTAKSSCPCGV